MMTLGNTLAYLLTCQLACATSLCAQEGCLVHSSDVYPAEVELNDHFGYNVQFAGTQLVVSAWLGGPQDTGFVHVFSPSQGAWVEVAGLLGSGVKGTATFGTSMATSASTILVGNPFLFGGDPPGEGAAYFFEQIDGVWSEVARVTPSDQAFGGAFGLGVAVSGDSAFIADSEPGDGIYVFERLGGVWTEIGNIAPVSADPFLFGDVMAYVQGDLLVSERAMDDMGFFTKHEIRVFRKRDAEWSLIQTLTEPVQDANWGQFFWEAANRVIVSAGDDDTADDDAGALYSYQRLGDEWVLTQVLVNPDPQELSSFGSVGSATGNRLVTGAYDFNGGEDVLYLYSLADQQWALLDQIRVPQIWLLAMSAQWIAVGNPEDGTNGPSTGAAYTYEDTCFCPADCNGDIRVNIFDFLCFQGLATTGDPAADCNEDGAVNIFDFICFQGLVTEGCG